MPVQAPLAVQFVALVTDHDKVAVVPALIAEGTIVTVTSGLGGGLTVSDTDLVPVPPPPEQDRLNLAVPTPGLTFMAPLDGMAPDQAPLAVHVVALVADHVNVALDP